MQAAQVQHQAPCVPLVVELLVERLRLLRVVARQDPVPHSLGDEGSLEIRVGDHAAIVHRLRQLERALHVLARGLEVALPPAAARPPAEDVGTQKVARHAGSLGQGERLVEERRWRSRCSTTDSDTRRGGRADRRGRRPRTAAPRRAHVPEPRARAPSRAAPVSASDQASPASACTSSSTDPATPADAPGLAIEAEGVVVTVGDRDSASARASIASTRARSSVETPLPRKAASTSSRSASHSTVSSFGCVLPRSIWLTYSFEKRSPASWVCVSPAATRSARRRPPSCGARGDRLRPTSSNGCVVHLPLSQREPAFLRTPPEGGTACARYVSLSSSTGYPKSLDRAT